MNSQIRISAGADVGGTFTDIVAVDASGRVSVAKVLTTPADRAVGVIAAVNEAALDANSVERFVHGTTVVTNLLLERAGTRVVLITTAGFTDILWLRRQERASLYDLTRDHPAPLVQPADVIAVQERVAPRWFDGETRLAAPEGIQVLEALTDAEADRVARAAQASGASAFAIVLLHAHVFRQHEQRLSDALRTLCPDATIVVSHEVLPEIREYERTATTVAEAYARPAVRRYIRGLSSMLESRGFPSPRVMTSAGGTLSAPDAASHAASLALSGPAGGVTAAAAFCRMLGVSDALTIDIGGTSADVGLIVGGEPLVERGGLLDGVPISLPRVLIETVAAGGGSIGRVDAGGALQAGPASAGADPGPACYGLGGTSATLTDAHVVCGHIAEGMWSGAVNIDAAAAHRAVSVLANELGRSVDDTARALLAAADATMARALRRVSVERGRDPRNMVLVAFGGAGALHACGLASQLGMTRIFVPPHAGVLSALGLALAPERRDGLISVMRRCDFMSDAELQQSRGELFRRIADGRSDLTERVWARMRYLGQGHELDVALHSDDGVHEITGRFFALHNERFGFTLDRAVELVGMRTALEGSWWPLPSRRAVRTTEAVFDGYDDGATLEHTVSGPGTIRLPDATLHVAANWRATALPSGGWWIVPESSL